MSNITYTIDRDYELEENDSTQKVKSEARENRGLPFRRYRYVYRPCL